jgi:hypothetical protein
MLAALGGADRSSSYIAPSTMAAMTGTVPPPPVSWDVPAATAATPYMPPPAQGVPPQMAASAPDLHATPIAPVPPPPAPAMPVDPGTMPGSLGAGAPAQPGAPTLGPTSQPDQMQQLNQMQQMPDLYRALFSGTGGMPPAAGYGMGS